MFGSRDYIDRLKELRDDLREHINLMLPENRDKPGAFRTFSDGKDTTEQNMKRAVARLQEIERLIADLEASRRP
jgi:hypothetical protein